VVDTFYALVDSIGDLLPDQMRDFILEGYDPRAVVDATAAPYGPGPGGGGTDPYGPGPGGGGTYLNVALLSGLRPDGSCICFATVKNVGSTIVPGFSLQWAITERLPD
jgi:hypothetical protein